MTLTFPGSNSEITSDCANDLTVAFFNAKDRQQVFSIGLTHLNLRETIYQGNIMFVSFSLIPSYT